MSQPTFTLESRELTEAAVRVVRGTLALTGIIALAVGLAILIWPGRTAQIVTALLAVHLIIGGIVHLGLGLVPPGLKRGTRAAHIALGVVFAGVGVLALFHLRETTVWLGVVLGIWIGLVWIIQGVVILLTIGDAPSKMWAVAFGALSLVAGVVLLFSPLMGATLLWVLIGIALLILGGAQLALAYSFGRGVTAAATDQHDVVAGEVVDPATETAPVETSPAEAAPVDAAPTETAPAPQPKAD